VTLPSVLPDTAIMPASGEVVNLEDEAECARALASIRNLETDLAAAKRLLSDALVARSRALGKKTLHTPAGKVTIKGGTETTYHAEELETELRSLGMPEERIREIVVETVTYSVKAVEAKQAAAANPRYAEAVERSRQVREKTPYVTVGS